MNLKRGYFFTRNASLACLVALSLLISSCHPNLQKGHYEGNLSQSFHLNNEVQPVGLDVWKKGSKYFISVKSVSGSYITEIQAAYSLTKRKIKVTIPLIRQEPFELSEKNNCFEQKTDYSVALCFGNQDFILNIVNSQGENVLNLSATAFAQEKKVEFEPSRTLTVNEAVKIALTRNFDVLSEFEKAYRAKKQVEAAYLGLLPSINVGTWLTNVALQWVSVQSFFALMVGDVVPFILPSRWIKAHQYSDIAQAEEVTRVLMNANLATEVEQMCYNFEKDKHILAYYKELNTLLSSFFATRQKDSPQFTSEFGAWTDVVLNAMALEITDVESLVDADRYALSQTLGFMNPKAIDDIVSNPEVFSIDKASRVDAREVADIALRRSFELKQIDYLVKAAHDEKIQVLFRWFDPAEDPNGNLGFALIPQFQIAKSKIRELNNERKNLQSVLISKTFKTVDELNEAIENYPRAEQVFTGAEITLKEHLSRFEKEGVDWEALKYRLDTVLTEYVRKETLYAQFRVARSKMDRIKLQGYYYLLLPKMSDPSAALQIPAGQAIY